MRECNHIAAFIQCSQEVFNEKTDLADYVEELETQMNQRRWRLFTPYKVQYHI